MGVVQPFGVILFVMGQHLQPGQAVLACRAPLTQPGCRWCRQCGCEGRAPHTVTRWLVNEPLG